VGQCLKHLSREGLCSEGPNYRLTDKGRALLDLLGKKQAQD
jgi:hypothetical protein